MLAEGGATFLKMEQEGRPAQGLGLLGGMGLLTNPDFEHWRTQRRMTQLTFHRTRLVSMGGKVEQAAAQILGRWEALETVDIDTEMLNVTMDIICRTIFSTDISGGAGFRGGASVSDQAHLQRGQAAGGLAAAEQPPLHAGVGDHRRDHF